MSLTRPNNITALANATIDGNRTLPLAGAGLLGAALTAVGSIAPWSRVNSASGSSSQVDTISGIATDGTFSLVSALIALVALVTALVRPTPRAQPGSRSRRSGCVRSSGCSTGWFSPRQIR